MVTIAGSLLSTPVAADAQRERPVPRIGFLVFGNPPAPGQQDILLDALIQGLRELGYVEGQSIGIEERWGRGDRLNTLAAELVRLKVDVIVTGGTPAALAAKQATPTIPIVATWLGDPVASGLVASLARPGGNVTGIAVLGPELFAKGLELLKEAAPRISRVGALLNPENPHQVVMHEAGQAAARALGVKMQRIDVRAEKDLDGAFAAALRERAEALLVAPGFENPERIARFAIRNRLPTMATVRWFALAGGLMSYGLKVVGPYRRAAYYVDRILKGANPADLPVEQPTKYDLVINLKTAKAIGLTIPQSLLIRANEVIE